MSHLEMGDWFLLAIIVLEFGATISYIWKAHYLESMVWASYAVASIALLLLSLKGRV